jgi:fucose 4-O-acetylase-like acetyltransferase
VVGDRLDELVAATPPDRERTVDFLRAASILAVVFGHWFVSIIVWRGGVIRYTNAVGVTTGLWLATWVFQVMPVFFFVGGFSNFVALESSRRRGLPLSAFLRGRLERLLRPSLVFAAVWAVVLVVLHVGDFGSPTGPRLWDDTTLLRGVLPPGATLPFGPLWFLAVYLVVVVLSPATVWLDRHAGVWAAVAMAAGAVVADVVGFVGGRPGARWFNVAFVLLFPHQLGHLFADGRLARAPRWVFWAMVVGGLGALVLLTNPWLFRLAGDVRFEWFPRIGHYPKSLIGTDVEAVSNAYPPTLCYLAAGLWAVGAVMLLRSGLARWLEHSAPWRFTIAVNSTVMTLFLWHMTAFLVAVVVLWPLGFGHEQDSTARWWLERPIWIAVPAAVLAGVVALFRRFERVRPHRPSSGVEDVTVGRRDL